jgi:hypothetical protein
MSKSPAIILAFTCTGSVRGDCGHLHTTRANAEKCLAKDARGCAAHGGYTDRSVVVLADIIDRDGDRLQVCVGEWLAVYGRTEDERDLGQVVAIDDSGVEVVWEGHRGHLAAADARRSIVFSSRPTEAEIAAA